MTIALVQSASISTDGVTPINTIAKAFAAPVTLGNRLVAFPNWGGTTGSSDSISADTVNGPSGWARIPSSLAVDTSGPQSGEVWELRSTLAGTPNITAQFNAAFGFRGLILLELSGCDPNVAAVATANGMASSTAFTTGLLTPSQSGSYLAAFCTNGTDSTQPTAGSGYTIRETPGGATQITGFEDRVLALAGPVAGTFAFASPVTGTVHLVAFAPASGPIYQSPMAAQQRRG